MKKTISLILSFVLLSFCFFGCADNSNGDTNSVLSNDVSDNENASEGNASNSEKTKIRIAGMKGPTSIGLVGILEDDSNGVSTNDYEFTLAGTADEITPKLIKGELDLAAVPANLASVLYNNTKGEIKLVAVNTLGVLYIVSKGENIESLEDLRGKTIFATGKGTTPEYTLRHILSKNGIDPDKDVTIDFKSEATEVVAAITKAENAVAMLPQPYVTVAKSKVEGFEIAIDLNEEWEKLNGGNGIVTGVIVGRSDFIEANKSAINAFLGEYHISVASVNEDAAAASKLVEKFGIFEKAAVIEKAIPFCNITLIHGAAMKDPVSKYLSVLFEQNPKSVGGTLPDDAFYYVKE